MKRSRSTSVSFELAGFPRRNAGASLKPEAHVRKMREEMRFPPQKCGGLIEALQPLLSVID